GKQRARPWCHAIPDSGFRRAAGLDTCARPRVHDRDGACSDAQYVAGPQRGADPGVLGLRPVVRVRVHATHRPGVDLAAFRHTSAPAGRLPRTAAPGSRARMEWMMAPSLLREGGP